MSFAGTRNTSFLLHCDFKESEKARKKYCLIFFLETTNLQLFQDSEYNVETPDSTDRQPANGGGLTIVQRPPQGASAWLHWLAALAGCTDDPTDRIVSHFSVKRVFILGLGESNFGR